MHVFPWAVTGPSRRLAEIEHGMRGFAGPVHFLWPGNDIGFREKELRRWRHLLPQAAVTRVRQCGHFAWEDAPEETLAAPNKCAGWRCIAGISRSPKGGHPPAAVGALMFTL